MPDRLSVNAAAAMPPFAVVEPQPFAVPARLKQQRSRVLKRQLVRLPGRDSVAAAYRPRRHTKLQLTMVGMACFIFLFGLAVSVQTLQTNNAAAAQVSALSKQADTKPATSDQSTTTASSVPVPSATKPSTAAVSQYVVAPDMARYLKIPKLGVSARVLQVGINNNGALGTPNNVFDTAWYSGSAKPGQPGATLIDGHVSSWTSHGVFYGIKTLVAGDPIQIVRGDGSVVNYQVVKTQVYAANDVDMQAAVNPITPGKSGLNLITCTGDVEKGTSEFTQRVIVFAQQV
jgi:LPXTG-site transpeptidase (sortase) family protein